MSDLEDSFKELKIVYDPTVDDDDYPPPLDKPGWVVFEVIAGFDDDEFDVEVIEFDSDSAVWHVEEGEGLYWWLKELDIKEPGYYKVEGITGHAYSSWTEYGEEWDVDWEHGDITRFRDNEEAKVWVEEFVSV